MFQLSDRDNDVIDHANSETHLQCGDTSVVPAVRVMSK